VFGYPGETLALVVHILHQVLGSRHMSIAGHELSHVLIFLKESSQ
jgi:hypothetical protein